jgi:hypothetical protein
MVPLPSSAVERKKRRRERGEGTSLACLHLVYVDRSREEGGHIERGHRSQVHTLFYPLFKSLLMFLCRTDLLFACAP